MPAKLISLRSTLVCALVLPLLYLATLRVGSCADGREVEQDCFYHAAMADLGPVFCMRASFPQLTLSIWQDRFSDKELGYHLLLSGIRSWQHWIGMNSEPPFHFPALVFAGMAVAAFVYACHRLRIRHIWFFSLLLVAASPSFCVRLLMLRPHVLAIALALCSFTVCQRVGSLRGLAGVAACGFAMAWSYSNPHFLLVPAVAVCAARLLVRDSASRRVVCGIPVATLGGIVLGYLCHPQFPNTFLMWKTQCVDVVSQAVFPVKEMVLGDELSATGWKVAAANASVFAAYLFSGAAMLALFAAGMRVGSALISSFIVASFFVALFLLQPRAMEYACPFTMLAAGLAATALARMPADRRWCGSWRLKRRARWLTAVFAAILAIAWTAESRLLKDSCRFKAFHDLAGFLAVNSFPPGTVIANVNWSDFPPLFYAAPQYRYLCGLDPMFGYRFSPERMARLEAFHTGRTMMSKKELAELTETRFAFVSIFGWRLAEKMSRHGYPIVYQGEDGWLFELTRPP